MINIEKYLKKISKTKKMILAIIIGHLIHRYFFSVENFKNSYTTNSISSDGVIQEGNVDNSLNELPDTLVQPSENLEINADIIPTIKNMNKDLVTEKVIDSSGKIIEKIQDKIKDEVKDKIQDAEDIFYDNLLYIIGGGAVSIVIIVIIIKMKK